MESGAGTVTGIAGSEFQACLKWPVVVLGGLDESEAGWSRGLWLPNWDQGGTRMLQAAAPTSPPSLLISFREAAPTSPMGRQSVWAFSLAPLLWILP